jgi:hypothetical protein
MAQDILSPVFCDVYMQPIMLCVQEFREAYFCLTCRSEEPADTQHFYGWACCVCCYDLLCLMLSKWCTDCTRSDCALDV